MDALDKTILEHLEFDGRSSMQDLSELTGLSRSAVFTRVKRMEDQGVIAGYTVPVNRKKLGMVLLPLAAEVAKARRPTRTTTWGTTD